MNILGFDTSQATTSACIVRTDGESFESSCDPKRLFEAPAHGRELVAALEEVRGRSGLDWSDLDAIAVGRGPGGYTGLRVGIATARALGCATGVELRGVCSLDALAAGISATRRLAVIDAKRGEVFCACYEGETRVCEPRVVAAEQLAAKIAADEPAATVAAGDGALRFRSALTAAGVVLAERAIEHMVRGLWVCRLAQHAPALTSQEVAPNYLRAPDARPAV